MILFCNLCVGLEKITIFF